MAAIISIVNRRYHTLHRPYHVAIDRGTPFGNPFPMNGSKDRVAERERVCDQYEEYFHNELLTNPAFKEKVDQLIHVYKEFGELTLFCWCHPFRCHGETIKRYILGICKKEQ